LYSTALAPIFFLLITFRHEPHRKHRSSVAVSIVERAAIGADGVKTPLSSQYIGIYQESVA
jgi:hypothetical protein